MRNIHQPADRGSDTTIAGSRTTRPSGTATFLFTDIENSTTLWEQHPAAMDRALRRLEAFMVVVNSEHSLLITGQGDVVQPSDGVIGIGSGGQYARAAARALVRHSKLSASEIVRAALEIAAEIDVYTNDNIAVEELTCAT